MIKKEMLNIQELSEFGVILELLVEGKIKCGFRLPKNNKSYLDILKVIRQEIENQTLEYIVDDASGIVYIKIQETDEELAVISMKDFRINASNLFNGIKDLKGSSVEAPSSVCEFAQIIYVSKPKAPAVQALKKQFGGKNDIYVEIRDSATALISVVGFSIKSKFGQPATLFNAGSSSQFLYKLENFNDNMMEEFNNIKDGDKRGWNLCKAYLSANSVDLKFVGTQNKMYNDNLFLVRESMGNILAWCVKNRLIEVDKDYEVMETVQRMAAVNPLNVPTPNVYYEKAVKDFLMASFTGMTATKPWDGKEQVNGGYIVVMDDGDVLCYHSNDRESFRDYLYRNTYFEYVATKKYNWGYVKKRDDEYILPLNISVRFRAKTR